MVELAKLLAQEETVMIDMKKMFRRASKSNYVDMKRLRDFDPA